MLEEASSKPMAVRERLVEKARFLKQCRHRILVPSERNAMRIKALTTAEPSRSSARPALEEDLLEMEGLERTKSGYGYTDSNRHSSLDLV